MSGMGDDFGGGSPAEPLPMDVRESWVHAHMIRAGLHAARGLATPPAELVLAPMAEAFEGRWCAPMGGTPRPAAACDSQAPAVGSVADCVGSDTEGGDCA
jgi:hypothetical protein